MRGLKTDNSDKVQRDVVIYAKFIEPCPYMHAGYKGDADVGSCGTCICTLQR
jgi:hypothetical protein